ncbi:MAG: Protein cbp3, mitochondrial [Caeruleum heppii]|nr:MAG: Protein cbp3, mitochondrial [Caeruleum heppii]
MALRLYRWNCLGRRLYPAYEARQIDPHSGKTHSPAPIVPPKANPPSQNVEYTPHDPAAAGTSVKLAQEVRRRAGRATETYIAYGVTENIYKECARQADYSIPQNNEKASIEPEITSGVQLGVGDGWWYKELGLQPTFNTWAQITMLHIYLLATRFRNFPAAHAPAWQQHLLDHFFYDAEERMVNYHGMSARGVRNRYLKDLFIQYRGAMAAYDEGLCKGDAVLATALWRNIFGASDDLDLVGLAQVVSYVRRVIRALEAHEDETIAAGNIEFGDPGKEKDLVHVKSKLMSEPLQDKQVDTRSPPGAL